MSLTRKIIDLARSNLNKLLEQAAATADPRRKLSQVSDEELEAELQRRRAAKQAEAKIHEAKARIEDARPPPPAKDRADRERAARERETRVKADRAARAAASAASSSSSSRARSAPPPPRGQQQQQRSAPPPPRGQNVEIARYYARLEITYGADFDEVKAAYRRLMRKYHPDLHAGKGPEKVKAANEVAAALTQAYNELERHLKGGPNR